MNHSKQKAGWGDPAFFDSTPDSAAPSAATPNAGIGAPRAVEAVPALPLHRGRWWAWGLAGVAVGAGMALLRVRHPGELGWVPPCPTWAAWGVYCPGCGSGRMMHALARWDWRAAFSFNPLAMLSPLFFAAYFWDRRRARPRFTGRPAFAAALVGGLLGYAILRNLPWPPFTWLAPGGGG